MIALLVSHGPYLLYVLLIMVGTFMLLVHRNLFKTLIGVYLIQSAIILFFISLSVRRGATIPIVVADGSRPLENPLPHALMLTAIVVGVATLGVGLAILKRIRLEQGTIDQLDPDSEL